MNAQPHPVDSMSTFCLFAAINHRHAQSGVCGNIDETRVEGTPGGRASRHGLDGMTAHALLSHQSIPESENAAPIPSWMKLRRLDFMARQPFIVARPRS